MYTSLAELLQQSGQTELLEQLHQPIQQQPSILSGAPQREPFIDVHTFDYSYAHRGHEQVTLTNQEKHDWIQRLIVKMNHPGAKRGAELILANIGMEANVDTTNNKTADDLLVLLSQHVLTKDESFLPMVEEQLIDMLHLGQCAQGRTTRLWQLYVAIQN